MHPYFSLQGRTALVTGGTRGIGKMIAKAFVEAGARVYVCSRDAEACHQTAEELSALFRKVGHTNYRPCGDQLLRNFLKGLTLRVRPA